MPATFLFQYSTDDNLDLNIRLDQARGTAASFPPGDNSNGPPIKIHGKGLRCRGVFGRNGSKSMFLPCPTVDAMNTLYTNGSFSVGGTTYTVTGQRGEQKTTLIPGS